MVAGQKAICIQFPLRLGYANTFHSIQGGTIQIGNTMTTSFEGIFGGSQAYTALGRVKQLEQLYLLEDIFEEKIYTSQKSLIALKQLEERAINDKCIGKSEDEVNIIMLNVQNLKHHMADVKFHHKLHDQNLIILSETWLSMSEVNETNIR